MAQNFDDQPHDHDNAHEHGHDEDMAHEHAEIHEAPTDDEFADDGAAQPVTEEKIKGRSPLLPILAAVGGIVVLGGVAYWQFMGSANDAVPSPAPVPHMTAENMPPVTQPAPVVAPKVASAPVMSETIPNNAGPIALSTMPASSSVPAPVSSAPVSPVAPTLVDAAATTLPAVSSAPVPPVAMVAADDHRIDALATRLDDLQKSLTQVTEQLNQVNNMVAAAAPAANAAKDLQDRLTKVEQQVAQNHAPAPLAGDDVMAAPAVKPVALVTHHHAAKKIVPKSIKHHTVDENNPVPTHWILRAAMPGQAWVATSVTDKDLKPVHVGDTLAGVGRITAITAKDGSDWVVEGTKSSVHSN